MFNEKQSLFALPMYYPLAYSRVPVKDGFEDNRQKQVGADSDTVPEAL